MTTTRYSIGSAIRIVLCFSILGVLTERTMAQPPDNQAAAGRWAIALHGGAGDRSRDMPPEEVKRLEESLERALNAGKSVLSNNGSALNAVEAVVVVLEDDPQFNAGRGAVFNRAGGHELDASIMDGSNLRCGAVAGLKHQKNPIKIARLVMERTPHVLLAGKSADGFATQNGGGWIAQDYFYTEHRFRELQVALKEAGLPPIEKPEYPLAGISQPVHGSFGKGCYGTVGCVALDAQGNLAAATSTGGLTGKMVGRVGDSPIIGAGNYANNKTCAVSCTGTGEEYIRHSIAAKIGWLTEDSRLTLDQSVHHCLNEILEPGVGGAIAVDRQGNIAMQSTTGSLPRAAADSKGRFETAIWFDE